MMKGENTEYQPPSTGPGAQAETVSAFPRMFPLHAAHASNLNSSLFSHADH